MKNINEKNLSSFFGNVPVPMELTFVGLCLGAPMQYRKNNVGLDEVCMLVPQKNGGTRPVLVTLGNNESVANGARSAIFHEFGLDKIISNTSVNEYQLFAEKFSNVFDMNQNNDYLNTIFERKRTELKEVLKRYYPENIKDFDNAVERFKEEYMNAMGQNKDGQNKTDENDSKKKQITEQVAQTM